MTFPKRSDPKGIAFSILKTLKYSDHFGFPLTAKEIHLRSITSILISFNQTQKTLQQMLKKNLINNSGDYYYLPGKKSLITQRIQRSKASKDQLLKAKQPAQQLSRVPHIKAIYLTGSLAMNNSKSNSDLDFMIITKEGKLWTTRFILTLITTIFGLRRTPGSRINAGKLCLNLYLCPSSYTLPVFKQNLYTAYELIQALPLYDPTNTRSVILAANPWISSYLANFSLPARPGLAGNNYRPARPGLIGQMLEYVLFRLQYFYMKPKLTREHITINSAFFHPHDPGSKVLSKLR